MINTNHNAASTAYTGLRKLIHQAIIQDFQTFLPAEDRAQDTFTRSSEAE